MLFSSCNSSEDLSGSYVFSGKGGEQDYIYHSMVVENGKLIPCFVIAYAFNDQFIIVAQKPRDDCFENRTDAQKSGNALNFWIANHAKEELIGPMSFEEYMKKRQELRIPEDLKMELKL
jgi:hypothetical protein